jgi:proline iminopeptidase
VPPHTASADLRKNIAITTEVPNAMTAVDSPRLFPPLEPYRHGFLNLDELHTMYWEECGNPDGAPVLFLHGGPGGGLSPKHRRFFDPAHYRIILFDQRGAGKSTPHGEVRANTTPLLVEDIERLRRLLEVEEWLVFGGSWGSTLALAYGEAFPERCQGFVLRGIFLCTREEIDWFLHGMRWFFPEAHAAFVGLLPEAERADILNGYAKRLFSDDPDVFVPAARRWSQYEGSCVLLESRAETVAEFGSDAVSLGVGRLEAHYFLHQGFLEEDQLISNLEKIRHLPAVIVQGRYDMVCPPKTAFRLHDAWPQSRLVIVGNAGHSAQEEGIAAALVDATEQFRRNRRFD